MGRRRMGTAGATALLAGALVALAPTPRARAFCGFYVTGADARLYNRASVVVLMREGTRTVLSMQNDYQGPPHDFAMVVPVPVVLRREQVRTLPRDVFDTIDQMAAPRLVEHWEQDPCAQRLGPGSLGTIGRGAGAGFGAGFGSGAGSFGVTVEARFEVGEYDIVILSARDSTGLDGWLRSEGYNIPEGAEEALRPYVQAGTKFFVAKVDVQRVRYEDGHAALSPLRVHYDSDTFTLPIRLGLLNSSGTQDLIVHVLASERHEVANRPNVTIPTNIDVAEDVRDRFGAFYAALFDRTLERNPGAAVTEYAWNAGTCDPCPGPPLDAVTLATLGDDVVHGPAAEAPPARGAPVVAGPPVVRVVPPTVGPLYSPDMVRRVVRRHINEVRSCLERHAAGAMGRRHTVTLDFAVGADGRVTRAAVPSSTIGVPAADRCIEQAVRRWAFPAPPGGGRIDVRYPLVLDTRSGGVLGGRASGFVLTRMHLRYGRGEVGEDLVFRAARPIAGGRESRDAEGRLEHGATPSRVDSFQGRYAIRHPWTGPVTCASPVRGIWGDRPDGVGAATGTGFGGGGGGGSGAVPATGLGLVARSRVDLGALLRQSVPELGVTVADTIAAPGSAAAQSRARPAQGTSRAQESTPAHGAGAGGAASRVHPVSCSAAAGDGPWSAMAWVLAAVVALRARRRALPRTVALLALVGLGGAACGGAAPEPAATSPSSGDEAEGDGEEGSEDGGDDEVGSELPARADDGDGAEPSACAGAACPFDLDIWLEQHGITEPLAQPAGLPVDTQAYDGGCRAIAFGEGGPEGLVCRTGHEIGGDWIEWFETLLVADEAFMRLAWTGPVEAMRSGDAGRALPSVTLERAFEAGAAAFTLSAAACDGVVATLDATPLDTLGDVRPNRLRRIFAEVCAARGRYTLERGSYRRAR